MNIVVVVILAIAFVVVAVFGAVACVIMPQLHQKVAPILTALVGLIFVFSLIGYIRKERKGS